MNELNINSPTTLKPAFGFRWSTHQEMMKSLTPMLLCMIGVIGVLGYGCDDDSGYTLGSMSAYEEGQTQTLPDRNDAENCTDDSGICDVSDVIDGCGEAQVCNDDDAAQAHTPSCVRGVWEGDFEGEPEQLKGYTSVNGDVVIRGQQDELGALSCLVWIEGDLEISDNNMLANTNGLSNLSVRGGLFIIGNPRLANIDGLSSLETIGGELAIRDNGALANIDGLSNLLFTEGALTIADNAALANIDGLSNLPFINDALTIHNNAALTNIDGLSNLASAGEVSIRDNVMLCQENVDALIDRLEQLEPSLLVNNTIGNTGMCEAP